MVVLNIKEIKDFAVKVFEEEKEKLNLENVKLSFDYSIERYYGKVVPTDDYNCVIIKLNLLMLLRNKKNTQIDIYKNIIHELEHAKTLLYTKRENCYSYDQLYCLMEYMSMIDRNTFYIDKISNLSLRNKLNISLLTTQNYKFSKSEILANYVSYTKMFQRYHNELSEEQSKCFSLVIDNYRILLNTAIIRYDKVGNALNGLFLVYGSAKFFVYYNRILLDEYPILRQLFDDNGNFRNIYELYKSKNNENADMVDNIIVSLMLMFDIDLSPYIHDLGFKEYLSELIGIYNNRVIEYYNNLDKINIMFENKQYLLNNFKLLKANVIVLNNYIEKYELERKSGYVLDYRGINN